MLRYSTTVQINKAGGFDTTWRSTQVVRYAYLPSFLTKTRHGFDPSTGSGIENITTAKGLVLTTGLRQMRKGAERVPSESEVPTVRVAWSSWFANEISYKKNIKGK